MIYVIRFDADPRGEIVGKFKKIWEAQGFTHTLVSGENQRFVLMGKTEENPDFISSNDGWVYKYLKANPIRKKEKKLGFFLLRTI